MTEPERILPSEATTDTPPPYVPPKCDVDGCDKDAVWIYTWAWGDTGHCCAVHGMLLQQKAKNLKRAVTLAPLPNIAAPALTRDERTQLHAARLAAEDETREAKERTATLYSQAQVLTSELGTQRRALEELTRQYAAAQDEHARLTAAHHEALAELATRADEIVRLRTLVDALEGAAKPSDDAGLAVPVDSPETHR
jgi:hypothetical protein